VIRLDDEELLRQVKIGLNADDNEDNDNNLRIKTIAVKQYLLNAGVSQDQVATQLGVATITIGVNDIWDLTSGSLVFSGLFNNFVTQLASKSIAEA
jgi:Trp operon repressor